MIGSALTAYALSKILAFSEPESIKHSPVARPAIERLAELPGSDKVNLEVFHYQYDGNGNIIAYLPGLIPIAISDFNLISTVQAVSITIATSATSGTATITSVSTTLSHAMPGGFTTPDTTSTPNEIYARIELTDATTATAYRNTSDASNAVTALGYVLEWTSDAIQSIQAGTITIASGSLTNTAAISAVTEANSAVQWLGFTTDSGSSAMNRYETRIARTSTTQLTATKDATTDATTVGYAHIEWKADVLNSATQQGSVNVSSGNTSVAATITAITMAQTMVFYGGRDTTSANMNNAKLAYLALTSTTQVTGTRTDTTNDCEPNFTAVEFKLINITLIQRNTQTIGAGNTTVDTSVTAMSAKGFVNYLGHTTTTNTVPAEMYPRTGATSTTNVRSTRNTLDATQTVTTSFEVGDLI